jgi:hypothetical protein
MKTINLKINGRPYTLTPPPDRTLLTVHATTLD